MEKNTIVTSIMDALKSYDKKIEDKLEGIKANYEAEQKRLNNIIESLQGQLKTKYNDKEFVLVHVSDLMKIMSKAEDLEGNASNLESDICELEYSDLSSVCSYIQDCSYTANSMSEDGREIFSMVEDLMKGEEEEKPKAKKAPAKKKTPKDLKEKIFGDNNNQ